MSIPTLQDWRVTSDCWLILFLKAGERYFIRRIRLGPKDAGLFTYNPDDGVALFARGRSDHALTRGLRRPHRPLKGVLLARGSVAELEAMAEQVWPVMRAVAEGVQPAPHLLNAAD